MNLRYFFVKSCDNPALKTRPPSVQFPRGSEVKKSQQDSVYVALRSMLQTRVLSQKTRERIKKALDRVNQEAAKQTLRQVVFDDNGSAAAD